MSFLLFMTWCMYLYPEVGVGNTSADLKCSNYQNLVPTPNASVVKTE